MSPPRWVDEHGQPCPTRPCPTCGRVIPVNRWPVKTLRDHEALAVPGDDVRGVVRASARGRAGARGRRLVLGDPGAGRGDVSYFAAPSRISWISASSFRPSRIARARSRSSTARGSDEAQGDLGLSPAAPPGSGRDR